MRLSVRYKITASILSVTILFILIFFFLYFKGDELKGTISTTTQQVVQTVNKASELRVAMLELKGGVESYVRSRSKTAEKLIEKHEKHFLDILKSFDKTRLSKPEQHALNGIELVFESYLSAFKNVAIRFVALDSNINRAQEGSEELIKDIRTFGDKQPKFQKITYSVSEKVFKARIHVENYLRQESSNSLILAESLLTESIEDLNNNNNSALLDFSYEIEDYLATIQGIASVLTKLKSEVQAPGEVLEQVKILGDEAWKSLRTNGDWVTSEIDTQQDLLLISSLIGLLLSLVIGSRSAVAIARPIQELAKLSINVQQSGNLSLRTNVISRDETGDLARAFNQMLSTLFSREAELSEYRASLEVKVKERTYELSERNRQMKLIFDNVHQGLAMVDLKGNLNYERSKNFDHNFKLSSSNEINYNLINILNDFDPNFSSGLKLGLSDLRDCFLPSSVILEQLPNRLSISDRFLSFDYIPMLSDENLKDDFTGVLLVVSDITDKIASERKELEQREFAGLVEIFIRDKYGLKEFLDTTKKTINSLKDFTAENLDVVEAKRFVHTLKGNTALFGMVNLPKILHQIEEKMNEGELFTIEDFNLINTVWQNTVDKISNIIDDKKVVDVTLTKDEHQKILNIIEKSKVPNDVIKWTKSLCGERADQRFKRISSQITSIAKKLGKPAPYIEIIGNDVRLPIEPMSNFWASFAHVIRNSMDHGIENQDSRLSKGKSPEGTVIMFAENINDKITIHYVDDGAGIKWDKIKEKAKSAGLKHSSKKDLITALFHPGLSTSEKVTEFSGRGVGMSALKEEVELLDGKIDIQTIQDIGTKFSFHFDLNKIESQNFNQ
jgi:nitrogen fixation/metabolism regulation signal transduction histidine kinase/HPt (histidine-containing phosphotransfer) domain-containing protein